MRQGRIIPTGRIVRQFQRRYTILDVNIENVIVFFSLIELLAILPYGINDISNLVPG